MRKDLTDLTVVLDRSGSMSGIRDDAEGGLNQFIADQRAQPGETLFTLVQFDDRYEFVHRAVPIRDVPHCELAPRGNTALLDAVGRAITETGERLKGMAEDDRPGLVVMVIITDGMENASREFSKAKVREMIEHQQGVYHWQFTYLGVGVESFAEAGALGIPRGATSPAVPTPTGVRGTYAAASANIGRMKTASAMGGAASNFYTDAERKVMADESDETTTQAPASP